MMIVVYFVTMFITACYMTVANLADFVQNRPQKVSITQETEPSAKYPTLTICSPAFFNKSKLAKYGLDDDNDDMANYLILSLQNDKMIPEIKERKTFAI